MRLETPVSTTSSLRLRKGTSIVHRSISTKSEGFWASQKCRRSISFASFGCIDAIPEAAKKAEQPQTQSSLVRVSKELVCALSPWLMILLFGTSYIFIVTSSNPVLEHRTAFLFLIVQLSNIAITGMSGLTGATTWAMGGPNTTSAIFLAQILQGVENIETVLCIQSIAALMTSLVMLWFAWYGIGRLCGDCHRDTEVFADYIHPSLVMALSQATSVLMFKFALDMCVRSTITFSTLHTLLVPEAVFNWLVSLAVGITSAVLDLRFGRQGLAMTVLLILPPVLFHVVLLALGKTVDDVHLLWVLPQLSAQSPWDTIAQLDLREVDAMAVVTRLPSMFLAAGLLYAEALCVYKSWVVVTAEPYSITKNTRACGLAHIPVALFGGWFGHQTFVESLVGHRLGVNSWAGAVTFVLCSIAVLATDAYQVLGQVPTVLPAGVLIYLGCVIGYCWTLPRLPPVMTRFEWMLSTAILVITFSHNFLQGIAIGFLFTTLLQFFSRWYAPVVHNLEEISENGLDPPCARLVLQGFISHGATNEVFDVLLDRVHASKLSTVVLDVRDVRGADSSLKLMLLGLSLLCKTHGMDLLVVHAFPLGTHLEEVCRDYATTAKGTLMKVDGVEGPHQQE